MAANPNWTLYGRHAFQPPLVESGIKAALLELQRVVALGRNPYYHEISVPLQSLGLMSSPGIALCQKYKMQRLWSCYHYSLDTSWIHLRAFWPPGTLWAFYPAIPVLPLSSANLSAVTNHQQISASSSPLNTFHPDIFSSATEKNGETTPPWQRIPFRNHVLQHEKAFPSLGWVEQSHFVNNYSSPSVPFGRLHSHFSTICLAPEFLEEILDLGLLSQLKPTTHTLPPCSSASKDCVSHSKPNLWLTYIAT